MVKILLMRHGASDFNVIADFYSSHYLGGPIFYRSSPSHKFRDSELSVLGKLQVNEMSRFMSKMPIKYMFVSPLRRCLESSYYLYRDVPPHKKPSEIFVVPELRELILSTNDIPHYWKTAIGSEMYSNYDFNLIKEYADDDNWCFRNCRIYKELMPLENICNKLLRFDNPTKDMGYLNTKFFNTMIKEENPHSLEHHEEIMRRVNVCKDIIKDFIKKKAEEGITVTDNQILVVSHFNLLTHFVGVQKFKNASQRSLLMPASAFTYDFDTN